MVVKMLFPGGPLKRAFARIGKHARKQPPNNDRSEAVQPPDRG